DAIGRVADVEYAPAGAPVLVPENGQEALDGVVDVREGAFLAAAGDYREGGRAAEVRAPPAAPAAAGHASRADPGRRRGAGGATWTARRRRAAGARLRAA